LGNVYTFDIYIILFSVKGAKDGEGNTPETGKRQGGEAESGPLPHPEAVHRRDPGGSFSALAFHRK